MVALSAEKFFRSLIPGLRNSGTIAVDNGTTRVALGRRVLHENIDNSIELGKNRDTMSYHPLE
jgi:hypothetical protein